MSVQLDKNVTMSVTTANDSRQVVTASFSQDTMAAPFVEIDMSRWRSSDSRKNRRTAGRRQSCWDCSYYDENTELGPAAAGTWEEWL